MINRQAELLTGLAAEDVAAVMALGGRIVVQPGDALFRLGEEADRLFVILRGRLALTLPMRVRNREEEILIEERSAGQTLGWSALIPPHRFTLTATAQADTEVLALPRTTLLAHFADTPAVGYAVTLNVAAVIGQRLQVFQAMWLREMQRVVKLSHA